MRVSGQICASRFDLEIPRVWIVSWVEIIDLSKFGLVGSQLLPTGFSIWRWILIIFALVVTIYIHVRVDGS